MLLLNDILTIFTIYSGVISPVRKACLLRYAEAIGISHLMRGCSHDNRICCNSTDHGITTLDGQNILYSVIYFVGLVAP